MKQLIIFALVCMCSCIFIRMDDSIDLGNKYRFIQDYPQTIIFHDSPKYEGIGHNIVPPVVISYKFDDQYIIAKSKDMEDEQIKYWIVNKKKQGSQEEPMDSISFYNELENLKIQLSL